jgi:hypothetical protein
MLNRDGRAKLTLSARLRGGGGCDLRCAAAKRRRARRKLGERVRWGFAARHLTLPRLTARAPPSPHFVRRGDIPPNRNPLYRRRTSAQMLSAMAIRAAA